MPSYLPAKIVTVWLYGVTLKDILRVASVKKIKETRVRNRGKKCECNRTSSSETLLAYSQHSMKTK
jgi:hypothetical protein